MPDRKFIVFLILTLSLISIPEIYSKSFRDNDPEKSMRNVLDNQVKAWNNGDMEQYMNGYWKSDSLRFIGKNGIKYGWQNTLNNYKKSYPDKATMGVLKFDILSVELLSNDKGFVIGKWEIKQEKGVINGIFSLLFKEIKGNWVIICDHTS